MLTARAGPGLGKLTEHVDTDVLIVGGGISGLSTALHLAEAGVDAVLLEGDEVGSGATGQSGGLIAPDFIRHSPDGIGELFGETEGERLTRFLGRSAQFCFDLVGRHGIDCEARQQGFYVPAPDEATAGKQRAHASQWSRRGFNVSFLDRQEARRLIGSNDYWGALHFGQGGRINPLGFARGLARAAIQKGASVFGDSRVDSLLHSDGRWQAVTRNGKVTARRVVLAANGGNSGLHPALRRTVLPLHAVEFATAPLSPVERASILPDSVSFTDKAPYLFTARYDDFGHLISAFPISFFVRSEAAFQREARRRLAKHFPNGKKLEVRYLWRGLAWINQSLLPEVYDLGHGALAIQACNGRGISTNVALGAELAEALATERPDALSVKPRPPAPIRLHRLASLAPTALMSLAYLSR